MVDLAEIQAAYYMIAATGVIIAAAFYVVNLREQRRSRRIAQTNELLKFFLTIEGQKIHLDLFEMKWSDYEDFERKYGTDTGEAGKLNCAMRNVYWYSYDTLGRQLKAGLIDRETLYGAVGLGAAWMWAKFRQVLEENRRRYSGRDAFEGLEYLAGEMLRMKLERDPSYKIPEAFIQYVVEK